MTTETSQEHCDHCGMSMLAHTPEGAAEFADIAECPRMTTFRDCGNGPEPVGEYFGPFATEAAARRNAAVAVAEAAAEAD